MTTSAPIENEHDQVKTTATTTRWDGSRLDRHYAIAALAPGLTSNVKRSA